MEKNKYNKKLFPPKRRTQENFQKVKQEDEVGGVQGNLSFMSSALIFFEENAVILFA